MSSDKAAEEKICFNLSLNDVFIPLIEFLLRSYKLVSCTLTKIVHLNTQGKSSLYQTKGFCCLNLIFLSNSEKFSNQFFRAECDNLNNVY